jgi:hypothetical protein
MSIYRRGQKRVSEGHSPNEGYDIQSRRVIGVAKELHKGVDNIGSHFGELHGTDVNRLYQ